MDEDDEENEFFGTPLPELDLDDDVIVKKAAQDLTVRDEEGRRRFHGAFTGGFSAGYYNTVGTKEGWEPSTFISSRSNKASTSFQQNPEDFMDKEDFGEFGIAPKKIHTTTNFRDPSLATKRKRSYVSIDSIIPGEAPLKDLIKPVRESIGIQILKELGWRPGQGIGPRVKKKSESVPKVYGCSLGPLSKDDNSAEITFAPEDTADVPYIPKDNFHGIGYSGLSTQSVLSLPLNDEFSLSKTKSWLAKDKKKLTIRGQAFGVGAFEDDDEDIYFKDDMSQYDFTEFLDPKSNSSDLKSKHSSNKYDSVVKVLEGFTLSTKPPAVKKYFPPPNLPDNFIPQCKFTVASGLSSGSSIKPKLGHIVRSIILGDQSDIKQIDKSSKPRRSRFDIGPNESDSQKRRSRFDVGPSQSDSDLQQRRSQFDVGPSQNDSDPQQRRSRFDVGPSQSDSDPQQRQSRFDVGPSQINSDSLSKPSRFDGVPSGFSALPVISSQGFKPFSRDTDKQARYETFIKMGCNKDHLKVIQPSSMTEWERHQEIDEFSKAAVLYQPLSDGLKSRFESGSHLGVELASGLTLLPDIKTEQNEPVVPKVGEMRRDVFEWHPTSLLCKRFNVPNPYPDSKLEGIPNFEEKKKKSLFDDLFPAHKAIVPVDNAENKDALNIDISDEPSTSKESIVTNKLEEAPKTKPPMDLFKEIFQSSSDEDSEPEEKVPEPNTVPEVIKPTSQIYNMNKVEKKGFGVFANLDLDALNKKTPSKTNIPTKDDSDKVEEKVSSTVNNEKSETSKSETPEQEDLFYGPPLPPSGPTPIVDISLHKFHKHKHKNKKKKKKKKRKHSKKDSDTASIDSDEDIPDIHILEKLKVLKDLTKT